MSRPRPCTPSGCRPRESFAAFCELVGRGEETNRPIKLAATQKSWCKLLREHRRFLVLSHVESGKSAILSTLYPLFCLGRRPEMRIAVIRNSEEQAKDAVRLIGRYLKESEELHEVFPGLKPAAAGPWNETSLTVERPTFARDASLRAYGIRTEIQGARIDLAVVDDPVDLDLLTEAPRRWLSRYFFGVVTHRVLEGGQLVVCGTPWSASDLYAEIQALGWPTFKFAVTDARGRPTWPERWSEARIAEERRSHPGAEVARALDCEILDEGSAVFGEEALAAAVERGAKHTPLTRTAGGWALQSKPQAWKLALGVDPAFSTSPTADEAALAAVLKHPGPPGAEVFELLALETGRWGSLGLRDSAMEMARRFGPDVCVCESNGPQDFAASIIAEAVAVFGIKTVKHPTGGGSSEWAMSRRLGELELLLGTARVNFPSVDGRPRDDSVAKLIRTMRYLSRADVERHTPDAVVALALAMWGASTIGKRQALWVGGAEGRALTDAFLRR